MAIAFAIPAALVGRALAVFCYGAISQLSPRVIPLVWQYILIWGGLRGAVAIVLV